MHTRNLALMLALQLLGCGAAASSTWDARASSGLRAEPQAMLHDLDGGNIEALIAKLDDDVIVLDLDEHNQPVRFQGRAQAAQYFHGLEGAMKSRGLRFSSAIARSDCSATRTVGFCVVEFDQTIHAGEQAMGPFKYRATVVARRRGDGWRWTHWHGSLREAPGQVAQAAPGAAPSAP